MPELLSQRSPRRTDAERARSTEVAVWVLLGVCVGSVEGSTVGVMVTGLFRETVSAATLGLLLAVLIGASNFANLAAVGWSAVARGREAAPLLKALQIGCAACVILLAGAPQSPLGLARVVIGVVGVRVLWSGILILRTSLWRLQFPRAERARVVAKIVALHYLVVAGTSATVAATFQYFPVALPWVHCLAALAGLTGAVLHGRVAELVHRSHDQKDPLEADAETAGDGAGTSERASLEGAWAIFVGDPGYRHYLLALLALDGGVFMAMAPLVLALHDVFRLDSFLQTALLVTIPTLTVPLTASFFATPLSHLHVLRFRARQGWLVAGAVLLFATGVSVHSVAVLFVASVLLGLGYAGGSITWHIAHHEFATARQSADYMVLNTLLTGVRGLAAPFCGVGLYHWAEAVQPGGGTLALFVPAAVSIAGAIGFVVLSQNVRTRTNLGTVVVTTPAQD